MQQQMNTTTNASISWDEGNVFVDISGCLVDRWCIPNTLPLYKLMVKEIPHTTTTILCIFEVDLVIKKF